MWFVGLCRLRRGAPFLYAERDFEIWVSNSSFLLVRWINSDDSSTSTLFFLLAAYWNDLLAHRENFDSQSLRIVGTVQLIRRNQPSKSWNGNCTLPSRISVLMGIPTTEFLEELRLDEWLKSYFEHISNLPGWTCGTVSQQPISPPSHSFTSIRTTEKKG